MGSRVVALTLFTLGCGAPTATGPARPEIAHIAGEQLEHVRETPVPGAGTTYELLDVGDPTKVLVRVERATGEARFERGANNMLAVAFTTAAGTEAWQLVVYRDDSLTGHTTVVAAPPPFRKIKLLTVQYGKKQWMVSAGRDPELYLPLDENGQLAWFPEGSVGVKPVAPVYEAVAWLVRWEKPVRGWSLALRADLSDVNLDGARWTDVHMTQFTSVPTRGGTTVFGFDAIQGLRPDGTCEVVPVYFEDYVNPRSALGPTCDEAGRRVLALYDAAQRADAERLDVLNRAQDAAHRTSAAQQQASSDAHARDQLALRNQYEKLVVGIAAGQAMPAGACELASTMAFATHDVVVNDRYFQERLLSGEIDCLVDRASHAAEREHASHYYGERGGVGTGTVTSNTSYGGTGDGAISDESRATARRTAEMERYTYGHGGVCPFAASLCR